MSAIRQITEQRCTKFQNAAAFHARQAYYELHVGRLATAIIHQEQAALLHREMWTRLERLIECDAIVEQTA